MKFFLFFLLTCFFGGMLLPTMPLSRLAWILAGLCTLIASGYFFLRMI